MMNERIGILLIDYRCRNFHLWEPLTNLITPLHWTFPIEGSAFELALVDGLLVLYGGTGKDGWPSDRCFVMDINHVNINASNSISNNNGHHDGNDDNGNVSNKAAEWRSLPPIPHKDKLIDLPTTVAVTDTID
jgi:hypothetical protein